MLIVNKNKFLKYKDVWFLDDDNYVPCNCDVCCLIGMPKERQDAISSVCYNSLISELQCDENLLDLNFEKVTKYDIRRSERDNLEIFHYLPKDLKNNNQIYKDFEMIYNEMYRQKGLNSKANIAAIKNMVNIDGTIITSAKCDGETLVYHVYVVDGKHARLWMSCSIFRESEDKQFRAKIGRANKRLHFEDLKYFNKNGYSTYDWGGVSSFENPNGIDQFKMSFGGKPISYYDITLVCSKRYKLYRKIKKMLKK